MIKNRKITKVKINIKIKILFAIITMLSAAVICSASYFIADSNIDSEKEVDIYNLLESQDKNITVDKVSASNYSLIQRLLDNIRQQVSIINSKIEALRKTDEYLNYPAVRLNVDTPMFGIFDIVDNDLKITYDVSSSDISDKYSINYVINQNKIKVPSYTVASFVVKTRVIEINNQMTQSDANVVIFKLLEYLSQVQSVNKKLDKQIDNILKGYISKDKQKAVNDINAQISDIEDKNTNILDMQNQLFVLKVSGIEGYITNSNNIYLDLNKYKIKNEDNLTKIEELNKIKKDLDQKYLSIIGIANDLQKIYSKSTIDFDKGAILDNVYSGVKTQNDYISNYISSSDGTFQGNRNFCYDYEINNLSNLVDKTYGVTSKNISDSMQKYKDKIEKESNDYKKQNEQNTDTTSDELKKKSDAENKENLELLKTLTKDYLNFLNQEYQFLKDNIDMLISDSNTKLTNIGKNTNYDISNYVEYVNLDYKTNINKTEESINTQSIVSLNDGIEKLKKELNTVLDTNLKINKIYKSQQVESSDMDRNSNSSGGNVAK